MQTTDYPIPISTHPTPRQPFLFRRWNDKIKTREFFNLDIRSHMFLSNISLQAECREFVFFLQRYERVFIAMLRSTLSWIMNL